METTCNTCHWTTCGYLDPSLLRCEANSLLGGWRIKHSCCSPPSPRSEQSWFQLLSSCFSLVLLPNRWVTMETSPWTASFLSRLSQFYHVLCPAKDLSLLYTVQENVVMLEFFFVQPGETCLLFQITWLHKTNTNSQQQPHHLDGIRKCWESHN